LIGLIVFLILRRRNQDAGGSGQAVDMTPMSPSSEPAPASAPAADAPAPAQPGGWSRATAQPGLMNV
jgi:hypothetical protein